jgi:teichoic acid transport system ATP-binding protein
VAEPTVIVDHLEVVYRVYGAGGDRGTAATALFRIIGRKTGPTIRTVEAIRGVTFIANRGDAIGIIGRNGSGKSTLLRAIAGLLPPERGTVYTTCDASLLGVNAALLDDLTGERNVMLGCLAMGMTKKEIRAKYDEIVDFSGVGTFIKLPMKMYSSGMGSRLRFAIAAAKDYEILLIDEALATGDAEFRVKSHARIDELRRKAGTVFLVAHDLEEVEDTCNRVIWLDGGKIIEQGEDVVGIIDRYIAASGGEKIARDPATGKRISAPEPATT